MAVSSCDLHRARMVVDCAHCRAYLAEYQGESCWVHGRSGLVECPACKYATSLPFAVWPWSRGLKLVYKDRLLSYGHEVEGIDGWNAKDPWPSYGLEDCSHCRELELRVKWGRGRPDLPRRKAKLLNHQKLVSSPGYGQISDYFTERWRYLRQLREER